MLALVLSSIIIGILQITFKVEMNKMKTNFIQKNKKQFLFAI